MARGCVQAVWMAGVGGCFKMVQVEMCACFGVACVRVIHTVASWARGPQCCSKAKVFRCVTTVLCGGLLEGGGCMGGARLECLCNVHVHHMPILG